MRKNFALYISFLMLGVFLFIPSPTEASVVNCQYGSLDCNACPGYCINGTPQCECVYTPVPTAPASTVAPTVAAPTNTPVPGNSCGASDATGCECEERLLCPSGVGTYTRCVSCGGGSTNPPAATNTPVPNPTGDPINPTATPAPTCGALTKPTNLIATCDAQGNTILKWDAVEGAQYYSLRVKNEASNFDWSTGCPANSSDASNVTLGYCEDQIVGTTKTILTSPQSKDTYGWWVHARCGNVGDWTNAPAEFGNGISCARPDKPTITNTMPVCSDDGWSATYTWQKPSTDPRVNNFILRVDLDNAWLVAEKFLQWFMLDGSDIYTWTENVSNFTTQVIPFRRYEGWSVQSIITTDPSTQEANPNATATGSSFACIPLYSRPSGPSSTCLDDVGNLSTACTVENFVAEYKRQYGYEPSMAVSYRSNPYPNFVQGKNAYQITSSNNTPVEIIDLLDYEAMRYKKYHPAATVTPQPTLSLTPTSAPVPTNTLTPTPTPVDQDPPVPTATIEVQAPSDTRTAELKNNG